MRLSIRGVVGPEAPFFLMLFPVLVASWLGGLVPGLALLVAGGTAGRWLFSVPHYAWSMPPGGEVRMVMFGVQGVVASALCALLSHGQRRLKSELVRRRRIEAALISSEARFRSLIRASSAIVWYADARGNFVAPQALWQEYTGQEAHEYQGVGWMVAYHPESRAVLRAATADALEQKISVAVDAQLWSAKAQQYRHVVMRGVPVLDAAGEVCEWIGTVTDVHVERSVTAALTRAKAAAEAAAEAKTQFLANISHELRTPLVAIMGFTDFILDPELSGDHRSHAQIIKRNAEHLLRLVTQVLDVANMEADRLEPANQRFSLLGLLDDLTMYGRTLAEAKGLAFVLVADGMVPREVVADPDMLLKALHILVGNAVKFTEQGQVQVSVAVTPAVHAAAQVGGGTLTLLFTVTDTGIGLSPAQQEQLFQPFSQVDGSTTRRFGGTGLGLYLAQRLARLMGGDLQVVASTLGIGSTFRLIVAAGALKTSEALPAWDRDGSMRRNPPSAPRGPAVPPPP